MVGTDAGEVLPVAAKTANEDVADLLREWSERTGTAVETWALPKEELPRHVAEAVRVVLREALSNVERYSGARIVSVAVTSGPRGLRLTVSDDGTGFDGPAAGPGTNAMRAAFTALGGGLTVNGVRGAGTTVTGALPADAWRRNAGA